MKSFLTAFALVICSCFFISEARSETDSLCDEQRFCSFFENVTKRVIEGPQYRAYITYTYSGIFELIRFGNTNYEEIFIKKSHVLMACDPSRIFSFTVRDNTSAPSNYSDRNNTESYECEHKIDDYSICINQSSSEVVSVR